MHAVFNDSCLENNSGNKSASVSAVKVIALVLPELAIVEGASIKQASGPN